MGKYIIPNLSDAETKIASDLDHIKTKLIESFGSYTEAIILCGGYGRGEGSFIRKDGVNIPVNDYDILIVTHKKIPKQTLTEMAKELAKDVNIRFVDLGVIKSTSMHKLPNTIFTFDLRASTLLLGNSNVLSRVPKFTAKSITDIEAARLLRNRLICFLELTPDDFWSKKQLNKISHQLLVMQVTKAVVAASISSLINLGKYHYSAEKQRERYMQFCDPKWKHLVKDAYNIKLGFKDPLTVNPHEYWLHSRDFFLQEFKKREGVNTGHNILTKCKELLKFILYKEKPQNISAIKKVEKRVLHLIQQSPNPNWNKEKSLCCKQWEVHHH